MKMTLTLFQGYRDARKQKLYAPIILQSSQQVLVEFVMLLWFVGLMNHALSHPVSIEGREVYFDNLTLNVLYHTMPHKLCEVKDVRSVQSVSTHSEESGSVLSLQ